MSEHSPSRTHYLERRILILLFIAIAIFASSFRAAAQTAVLLTKENLVDIARERSGWSPGAQGQSLETRDRVRTGELSRATVRLTDSSVLRMDELTTVQILPPEQLASAKARLDIKRGAAYFFSRE